MMKIRNLILSLALFVLPLFLLNWYTNPEQPTKLRIFHLVLLITVALINHFLFGWLNKKYPYQSSYKPKNKPILENTTEKNVE